MWTRFLWHQPAFIFFYRRPVYLTAITGTGDCFQVFPWFPMYFTHIPYLPYNIFFSGQIFLELFKLLFIDLSPGVPPGPAIIINIRFAG